MLKLEELLKPAIDKPKAMTPTRQPAPRKPPKKDDGRSTADNGAADRHARRDGKPQRRAADPRNREFKPEIAVIAKREAQRLHQTGTVESRRAREKRLRRIAERLTDPGDIAVAWLQDSLTGTGLTAGDLEKLGIPTALVEDVVTLTHQGVEKQGGHIERIGTQGTARAISLKAAEFHDLLEPPPGQAVTDGHRHRHALKRLRQHAKRRGLSKLA